MARKHRRVQPTASAIQLLHDGTEAFPAMRQAINGAEQQILVEMCCFAADGIGQRFAKALREAAARNVDVVVDDPSDPKAHWLEYEFECKPGSVDRRPCVLGSYHHRVDWQIWFAAMSNINRQPWLVHLIYKLLQGDPEILALLDRDPFAGRPPKFVRAELFEYQFSTGADPDDIWWTRRRVRPYLPAISVDDPELRSFLRRRGWLRE